MEEANSDEEGLYASSPEKQPAPELPTSYDSSYIDALGSDELDEVSDHEAEITAPLTKRKGDDTDGEEADAKRPKIDEPPKSLDGLPVQVLRRSLSLLHPRDLLSCLHVNRHLRSCLTAEATQSERESLDALTSNDVWRTSRETFADGLLEPLNDLSELQMLDMLLGTSCQNCHSQPTLIPHCTAYWNSGPGRDGSLVGVRCIWHYGRRLCGNCLETVSGKDVDLLVTADKFLLPGLPHILCTADMHYVPPSLAPARNSSVPPSVQIAKWYSKASLGKLRALHESMKSPSLPPGTAEMWLRDIHKTKTRRLDDAARWVTWEASRLPGHTVKQYTLALLGPKPALHVPVANDVHDGNYGSNDMISQPMPYHLQGSAAVTGSWYSNLHATQTSSNGHTPTDTSGYASQNLQTMSKGAEAKQLIAARKAEIERRCMEEFYPPLLPNVLERIAPFKAALQIPRPFTDDDWRYLKPRLEENRLQAEQEEQARARNFDSAGYVNAITQRTIRRAPQGTSGAVDMQREKAQRPVRRRLQDLAQQVIDERWAGAVRLVRADCANFAADVLVTTLSRFNSQTDPQEFEMGLVVTLESVKNLFDNRVKPSMDKLDCKEMFLCSECEESSKWYTFDGMMQHFGAKHESDFSVGNIVVAWQLAEWPEDPPFKPHPVRSRRIPPAYAELAALKKAQAAAVPDRANQTPDHPLTGPAASPTGSNQGELPSFLSSLRQPSYTAEKVVELPVAESDSDLEEYVPEPAPKANTFQANTIRPRQEPSNSPAVDISTGPKHLSDNPALKAFQAPPQTVGVEAREVVAKISLDVLKKTAGLNDLVDSVRLYVIFWHTSQIYQSHFGKDLTLAVLRESVSTRPEMKNIKRWSGLRCKVCVDAAEEAGEDVSTEALSRSEGRHYILALLDHFRLHHTQANFLTDMLQLPDIITLRNIPYLAGMTDAKLQLIASALPASVFPNGVPAAQPPPVSYERTYTPPADVSYESPANALGNDSPYQPASDKQRKRKRRGPHALGQHMTVEDTDFSMPEAAEDEYDPRRPTISKESPDPEPYHRAAKTRRSKGRHSDGEQKPGHPAHFFDYHTSYIPDVIRSDQHSGQQKPAPALTGPPAHSPHPQQFAPPQTGAPLQYFDQYGNPVFLDHLRIAQAQQHLAAAGQAGASWAQPPVPLPAGYLGAGDAQKQLHYAAAQPTYPPSPWAAPGASAPGYSQYPAGLPLLGQYPPRAPQPGYGQPLPMAPPLAGQYNPALPHQALQQQPPAHHGGNAAVSSAAQQIVWSDDED